MVIESIDNIEVAYELGKMNNIDMPILYTVYDILYKGLSPQKRCRKVNAKTKKIRIKIKTP